MFEFKNPEWTRLPESYVIGQDSIKIVTAPRTDLWQRTYYHFRNDNAPVLQVRTKEKFFSFVVKTVFESKHRFDQCGVVLYLDSENWLKASIEYENEEFQHLGSVVTNHGYSDWATTAIPADIKSMWYRLSPGKTISVLNAPRMGYPFPRSVYATCGKQRMKSALESMPAARRIRPSRQPLPILPSPNANGWPTTGSSRTDFGGIP